MEFKTDISKITENDMILRGEKLSALIDGSSFTDVIFLLLQKRKPTDTESKIFSAMLTSIIDHGMGTTSSLATRFVMSAGNSLNTAVSAGISALGDRHGGAIENSMMQLKSLSQEQDVAGKISDLLANKSMIYGFGHSVYKEEDPRVAQIIALCKKLNYDSKYVVLAKQIESMLEQAKGKKLCLNIDGLIAAILLEMGFSTAAGRGVFIIGRTPGLVAQAIEEKENEKSLRRLDEDEIKYTGKQ